MKKIFAFFIGLLVTLLIIRYDKNNPLASFSAGQLADTIKKASVTVEEVTVDTMNMVVIRDTAVSAAAIGAVLNKSYSELFPFISQNNLTPGKVMAFYYSSTAPFIMEAAVQVDKLPYKTTGRIKINQLFASNAIVAHYKGPYQQVSIAYEAIDKWMKQKQKAANGAPYEVYLNNMAAVADSFDLRTDVYQLLNQ